jgi:hypothetical protein
MRLRTALASGALFFCGLAACSDVDSSIGPNDDGEDYAEPTPAAPDGEGAPATPPTTFPAAPLTDAGADAGPSVDGGIPHAPLLRAGLHPDASDRLRFAGIAATQITQTIGNAAASAGTHAADGAAGGKSYSAATDISIKNLNDAQVKVLIDELAKLGFAPYYRKPGADGWPASEARHLHVVYAGCKMKLALRNQMRDFFAGKNALASHTMYTFYTWPPSSIAIVKALYLKYNPATG